MLIRIVLGLVLIIIGVIGLILLNRPYSSSLPRPIAITAIDSVVAKTDELDTNASSETISGTPALIEIPSLAINLKIDPGYYNPRTELWTVSLNNAQFATITAPANNKGGLTFIYGHYRPGVFLTLPKIIPGDQAKITATNGHTFLYTYRSSVVTVPADTSLFTYRGKPILVIQTCSGSFYQDRQLFIFDFTKVLA